MKRDITEINIKKTDKEKVLTVAYTETDLKTKKVTKKTAKSEFDKSAPFTFILSKALNPNTITSTPSALVTSKEENPKG